MEREEVERLIFYEQTREQAAAEFRRNPQNPENLTKLGGILVELAQFAQGPESSEMIKDAISKLEAAVAIKPRMHEALWWLGNAHITEGFQTPDLAVATLSFEKGAKRFKEALTLDPTNDEYRKYLEMALKGPELHQEMQMRNALRGLQQQQLAGAGLIGGPEGGEGGGKAGKKKASSELGYDVAGWVILTVSVGLWLTLLSARSAAAAPPR
eukprot:TRINITY_DN3927_c0_g2_i1.p1 TRINITY_DN3927_c0_g2~~TRINITY_DN3927_c0_g2_i1.p1  ORF type:complete len:212 (-),score=62.68 TRINITY_DN3927_c0_g2_i1:1043-1678(-)